MIRLFVFCAVLLLAACIPAGDSVEFNANGTPDISLADMSANHGSDGGTMPDDMSSEPDLVAGDMSSSPDMTSSMDMSQPSDMSSQMDMSNDMASQDLGADMVSDAATDACIPETDSELCQTAAVECGMTMVTDSCGTDRTINCGGCAQGAECQQNGCVERDCRDNDDNDGDGLVDCADSDCQGRQCSPRPFDRCTAAGTCERS